MELVVVLQEEEKAGTKHGSKEAQRGKLQLL